MGSDMDGDAGGGMGVDAGGAVCSGVGSSICSGGSDGAGGGVGTTFPFLLFAFRFSHENGRSNDGASRVVAADAAEAAAVVGIRATADFDFDFWTIFKIPASSSNESVLFGSVAGAAARA